MTPTKNIPVREIPCKTCGTLFGQTAFQLSRSMETCPPCRKAYRLARNPLKKIKKRGLKTHFEVVLPKTRKPWLDKKRGEWCMRVRVRRKGSGEPFQYDKVYLGLGKDADPAEITAAFTAAYARMELNGASKHTAEAIKDKYRRIKHIREDVRSWSRGRDRDIGITRQVVQRVMYRVYLPDPKVDGEKHYVGRYSTRAEARKARDAKYKELRWELTPCAVCGIAPVSRNSQITHFSANCPNKVQLPFGVRPLFQAKLWNIVFSEGKNEAGKLTQEDLYYMGFMYKSPKGFRYFARSDVEFDFSLAKKYIKERKALEEETLFE